MVVIATGTSIRCPDCGLEIPISKKAKENPLYCPDCLVGLFIEDESGERLNLHWAVLTPMAKLVAIRFGIDRFPSEAISTRWRLAVDVNKKWKKDEVVTAAESIKKATEGRPKGIGSSCFALVLARLENRVSLPTSERPSPIIPKGEWIIVDAERK